MVFPEQEVPHLVSFPISSTFDSLNGYWCYRHKQFTVDGETDLDHLVQYFQQFDSMAECKLAEDALGGLLLVTFISLGLLLVRLMRCHEKYVHVTADWP
jgi:hypothetical protein